MQEIRYCLATEDHSLKRTATKILMYQWAPMIGQKYAS